MNCVITSANIFSGQSAVTSRIFPVQSAVSVRKSTPDRPFVCPILLTLSESRGKCVRGMEQGSCLNGDADISDFTEVNLSVPFQVH